MSTWGKKIFVGSTFYLSGFLSTVFFLPQGHSPAGGCLMALSCDYRVMAQGKFTIGLNEVQLVSISA